MCSMACAGLKAQTLLQSHMSKRSFVRKKAVLIAILVGCSLEMYYYSSIKNMFSYPFCHDVYGLVDELEARFYPVKVSAAVGKF